MLKELLDDLLNLGLGTAVWTKDKAQAVVDSLVKQGEIGKEESTGLIKGLIEKGEEAQKEIRKQAEKVFAEMLAKSSLPTRKEVSELRAEIEELKKALKKEVKEVKKEMEE
ncbi:MAG: hypothetical protein NTV33_00430 [Coprothermobacterota bacterium]|nr:hypothetical protein [Coprothermobacterota bacterium]